jgi:hypothetical protein
MTRQTAKGLRSKGRKQFFFEKKNQKTFVCYGQHPIGSLEASAGRNEEKLFASFFQKRSASSVACRYKM